MDGNATQLEGHSMMTGARLTAFALALVLCLVLLGPFHLLAMAQQPIQTQQPESRQTAEAPAGTLTPVPRGLDRYDLGAAAANVLTVSNKVSGDTLTLSGSATLAGANAGSENIASFAGLTLGGTSAANYTLTGATGSVTVTPYSFTYAIGSAAQTSGTAANLATDLGTTISTGVSGQNLDITYSSTGDTGLAEPMPRNTFLLASTSLEMRCQ